jgi:hypothetical protein
MNFINFLFFKQINKEKSCSFFYAPPRRIMEKIRRFIATNSPEWGFISIAKIFLLRTSGARLAFFTHHSINIFLLRRNYYQT